MERIAERIAARGPWRERSGGGKRRALVASGVKIEENLGSRGVFLYAKAGHDSAKCPRAARHSHAYSE